jgi:hypothetical protein
VWNCFERQGHAIGVEHPLGHLVVISRAVGNQVFCAFSGGFRVGGSGFGAGGVGLGRREWGFAGCRLYVHALL